MDGGRVCRAAPLDGEQQRHAPLLAPAHKRENGSPAPRGLCAADSRWPTIVGAPRDSGTAQRQGLESDKDCGREYRYT